MTKSRVAAVDVGAPEKTARTRMKKIREAPMMAASPTIPVAATAAVRLVVAITAILDQRVAALRPVAAVNPVI